MGVFEIGGRQVIDQQYHLEVTRLSEGMPGEQDVVEIQGASVCGERHYLRGVLQVYSRGCKNAQGATGLGAAQIVPTQSLAIDGPDMFLIDGDQAMCQGFLAGTPSQKPGPCQCRITLRAGPQTACPAANDLPFDTDPTRDDQIVALAWSPQDQELLAFTPDELRVAHEEWLQLSGLVDYLHHCEAGGNAEEKRNAAEAIKRKVLRTGTLKASGLKELWWHSEGKQTYVRSEKLKNHWRRYRVKNAANGLKDLDWKAARKRLTKKKAGIKPLWSDSLEARLAGGHVEKTGDNYRVGAEYALVRLVMSGSAGTASYSERRLKLAAEGKVQLQLASGRVEGELHFPDSNGWSWDFTYKGERYDFGAIRVRSVSSADAYAGVNLLLSSQLHADVNQKAESGLKLSGEAFAGAEISLAEKLALDWKAPGTTSQFRLLAEGGYAVALSAGAGLAGEFTIDWENGRFMIRAKAKAVLGIGGGGMFSFIVDAAQLKDLFLCVGSNLWRLNFHFLSDVAKEAFGRLSAMWAYAIAFGEEIGETLLDGINDVMRWWKNEQHRKAEAEAVAKRVLAAPGALRFATPQAKGRILHTLCERFFTSREERQETAIVALLKKTVRTRREFDEVCRCITGKGHGEGCHRIPSSEGLSKLLAILDGKDRMQFHIWSQKLPAKAGGPIPRGE